ncbi:putative DNA replication regulator sld-2 [Cladorrhinum sp. PSN259]|nr:putative DNA replication regulator sld-2 [Cladorrhinum sp. PSN259]
MDYHTKAEYENQSLQVRAELKKWETDWANAHNGQKPSRNDIKQNPVVAQKYKQYNKLRDIISGKIPLPSTSKLPPATPNKRSKTFQTPRKTHSHHPEAKTPGTVSITAATPATNRKLFSPALPTSIGPTPQKDGRVLGLFDLLGKTPSKPTENPPSGLTPSKRRASEVGDLTTPSAKRFHPAGIDATPHSKSHSELFGSTATPLHERPDNNTRKTPSSTRSFKFSTPAFLRRTTLPPVDEQDENGEWKVGPLRLPRKFLPGKGPRGLSQIVTSLRTIQDEAFEDEEEALREMEMGGSAPVPSTKKPTPSSDPIEIEDSQLFTEPPRERPEKPVLLSAFDDEGLYDSDNHTTQLGRDGLPLRVFKKRGQKRTTRKVNIKPTRTKRPSTNTAEHPQDDSDSDNEVIPETQHQPNQPPPDDELLLSGSDFGGEDGESDFDELSMEPKKGAKKEKKTSEKKGKDKEKKEGVIKKTVRMVKATAHANYKRLKLRQNGAKGGPGHNSRFRRRR